jgi:hypothetical protein
MSAVPLLSAELDRLETAGIDLVHGALDGLAGLCRVLDAVPSGKPSISTSSR